LYSNFYVDYKFTFLLNRYLLNLYIVVPFTISHWAFVGHIVWTLYWDYILRIRYDFPVPGAPNTILNLLLSFINYFKMSVILFLYKKMNEKSQ